jgi:hypothetical protein
LRTVAIASDPISFLTEALRAAAFLLADIICSTLALPSWHALASHTGRTTIASIL